LPAITPELARAGRRPPRTIRVDIWDYQKIHSIPVNYTAGHISGLNIPTIFLGIP
tara:strand:+ start:559 stop:723 length:165 start_codon:yes stop_codon:yes gene_type:complete